MPDLRVPHADQTMGTLNSALEIGMWTFIGAGFFPMLFALAMVAVMVPIVLIVFTGGLIFVPVIIWLLVRAAKKEKAP